MSIMTTNEVEAETIGDWAGHTPVAMDLNRRHIDAGIASLVEISGRNSRDHGFHDDWPARRDWEYLHPSEQDAARRAIAEKLALIHEEISEMLGEIRSGHDPLEIYYIDNKGTLGNPGERFTDQHHDAATAVPLLKPEGFLVDAADAMIRLADLTFLVRGREQLVEALQIKHEYNATRPYKHGRKF